jgi:hypothetical protein
LFAWSVANESAALQLKLKKNRITNRRILFTYEINDFGFDDYAKLLLFTFRFTIKGYTKK